MAIIKCKMCGGDLEIIEGSSVCECTYCGTKQTVPSADNEKMLTLFARAGRLLRACEFDKAAGVFETIVADFPEEAEAYWGLVLCKYGIEYVDDPATGKKIPTCHRSSFDSVMKDANFEQACENTDAVARRVYRDEARQIEELRKSIIEVSDKEEPYDVFISYKEKDSNGERTQDSVIAQEIYRELSREGYRVFFSRISLENRLGTEYEPYIFAALNSAKVMIVVGTDYENFDAVWVKNEWSRFLKLIAKGERKTLIPVFRDMDAYDMPEEFNKLTALDMGKVGAMQDLVHGMEKIVGKKKTETTPTLQPTYVSGGPNVTAMLKRGQQALEDSEWDKAREFFNQVLNMDAENAEAFLGLFLATEKCADEKAYIERACAKKGEEEILYIPVAQDRIDDIFNRLGIDPYHMEFDYLKAFEFDRGYKTRQRTQQVIAEKEKQAFLNRRELNRAFRFAKGSVADRLDAFKSQLFESLDENVAQAKAEEDASREAKKAAYTAHLYKAENKTKENCAAEQKKKEQVYQFLSLRIENASAIDDLNAIKRELQQRFFGYKDCAAQIERCNEKIAAIEKDSAAKAEAERLRKEAEAKAAAEKAERQRILAEKVAAEKKAKQKRIVIIAGVITVLVIAAAVIVTKVVIPNKNYNNALSLMAEGRYEEAISAFEALEGYRDSDARITEAEEAILALKYAEAQALFEAGQFDEAIAEFESLGNGTGFQTEIMQVEAARKEAAYKEAEKLLATGDIVHAAMKYGKASDHLDAQTKSRTLWNQVAQRHTICVSDGAYDSGLCAAIRSNGTVVVAGDGSRKNDIVETVSSWKNIVDIAVGEKHIVGLKADGTVLAAGDNYYGQCEVSDWKDIVAICAGGFSTSGLRSDGTVVSVGVSFGGSRDVSDWNDIVSITMGGDFYIAGLKANGTVVIRGIFKEENIVSRWTDVVAIDAFSNDRLNNDNKSHLIGLKSNGTVVAAGDNRNGQCEVSDWADIAAVSAGEDFSVGLRNDGTMVSAGSVEKTDWTNMVSLTADGDMIMALLFNGRISSTFSDPDVSNWTNIMLPK